MDELEILRRRAERERVARKEAERIAESKTRELYFSNKQLLDLNERLQDLVDERTADLVHARDQAVAANTAKSAFLANMSHELRTPLNAVIGYSEMILEEHADGPASLLGDVRKIHGAGRHLLALINDVLDLSKVEAGKMAIYREDVDIVAIVADVVDTVRPLEAQTRNKLEVDCAPGLGEFRTDVVKLRQVLFNLLSNAFKFTQEGHVTLRVWRDDAAERVWFEVRDTGIGIPNEQLDKLFMPFSQGDASTTRRYGGTGLGLALSLKFCEMLEGEINVESEAGRGSVFRFWLPARAEQRAQPIAHHVAPDGAEGGKTILVVDDDLWVHELLTRYLASTGLRVVCTADPTQALELARSLKPLAITLDVLMPRKDGWSVLSDLKQDPTVAEIPVILMSIIDDRGFGFALGAADYLVKPVPRARLLETLRRHADRGRQGPVLVVEDDAVLRGLMVRALTSDGWPVAEAQNGRVALTRVSEQLPALVVLDLMMPEMDGFEFLAELRRVPGGNEIPVVVVTAKDLSEDDIAFFQTNARVVLKKCVYDHNELLQVVQRVVDRSLSAGGNAGGARGGPAA